MIRLIVIMLVCFLMVSCAFSHVMDKSAFKARWEQSLKNSSASWWYVGETEKYYYLTEKRFTNHFSYEMPKTMIKLVGVDAFGPCKACEGTNLKIENVKFNENDL